jgi:hypothetical protein
MEEVRAQMATRGRAWLKGGPNSWRGARTAERGHSRLEGGGAHARGGGDTYLRRGAQG